MPITVSILEDDNVTRESFIEVVRNAPGLEFFDAYPNAEQALSCIPARLPDVLMADINLPGKSGIECISKLKAQFPKLQILMVTTYEDTDNIFKSLRAGASGYILKRHPKDLLVAAIKDVSRGGAPMSPNIARKVVSHFHAPSRDGDVELQKLTPRENEILGLLAEGLHYKEIADRIGVTTGTVGVHLHNIYEKLHVQSRTEAVVKYLGKI